MLSVSQVTPRAAGLLRPAAEPGPIAGAPAGSAAQYRGKMSDRHGSAQAEITDLAIGRQITGRAGLLENLCVVTRLFARLEFHRASYQPAASRSGHHLGERDGVSSLGRGGPMLILSLQPRGSWHIHAR